MCIKRSKFLFPIVLILSALFFCSFSIAYAKTITSPKLNTTYKFPRINNLTLIGKATFIIKKSSLSSVTVTSSSHNGKSLLRIKQYANHLDINVADQSNYDLQVRITTPMVFNLTVANGPYVKAPKLSMFNLRVIDEGNYNIKLRGQFCAAKTRIDQSSFGKIKIEWLDSDKIIVNSNKSMIWLTGETRNLIAYLTSSTYLDALYLRADNVYVKTSGTARADVSPLEQLVAITRGKSNVYYYTRPKNLFFDSTGSSNVLLLK